MTITAVAKKLGVSSKTIKRWEDIGKIKKAKRNYKGWRVYDQNDALELMAYHLLKSLL